MLILPVQVTHNILAHPVVAFDVDHGRDPHGRPTVTQGADYVISDASIQPADDDMVKMLPIGAQAEGAQLMYTSHPVKLASNFNGGSTGWQTYVRLNGDVWKAWALQDWNPRTTIKRYILTRYVNVDGSVV